MDGLNRSAQAGWSENPAATLCRDCEIKTEAN